jgi:hypothetical protein
MLILARALVCLCFVDVQACEDDPASEAVEEEWLVLKERESCIYRKRITAW